MNMISKAEPSTARKNIPQQMAEWQLPPEPDHADTESSKTHRKILACYLFSVNPDRDL